MRPRQVRGLLLRELRAYPAVALVGPRQAGKTTLAKSLTPLYFDLEQDADRLRLDLEWDSLKTERRPIVLDEAHVWPEIFFRLRGAIDEDRRRTGRFLILGSIAPGLMRAVSESLAGRLALCELTPFLLKEVRGAKADDLWLKGGYPDGGILSGRSFPDWQLNYLDLLAQRDLPHWGLPAKPKVTDRLFRMLAAVHGGIWNASQVGKSLGLNYHTINSYLDYLESAFLIRRLPPYSRNLKKRLVKSPKIYWRDSGLLHALLGVRDFQKLLEHPAVGFSWEGWVIEQILSQLRAEGKPFQAFFLRTGDDQEIDLLLEMEGRKWAFEVKLASSPDEEDVRRLNHLADLVGAEKRVVISRARETLAGGRVLLTNMGEIFHHLFA